ncbi:MAG: hypothetical protein SOV58_05835 [Candidatus Enteromonas sp.]|nr:hypothetical protein [Candidatus Enteromonas sp.]
MTKKSYRGKYHYSVPKGWMNDPNGCIFYRGEFHIFYQSNPHSPTPTRVGWGHVSTQDFLHFQQYPEPLVSEYPYPRRVWIFHSRMFHPKLQGGNNRTLN